MMSFLRHTSLDWVLFLALIPLLGAGLVTINSFVGDNIFFTRQIIWVGVSLFALCALSFLDFRFLRRTDVLVGLFLFLTTLLVGLLFFGDVVKGARSWITIGSVSFQPADPMKLVLILILAKYFSRRHIDIARTRHIFISGLYAVIPFVLILLQPDFGSALIIFIIWLGMVMVSGISKKHLMLVIALATISFAGLWMFGFTPNQKERIVSFLHPLADIQGAGYNAFQSTIAVGSGGVWGKGIGFGTQSRLEFLPEYETDFIFAAFAEEWGFIGVVLLFALFGVVIWRILRLALLGASNFEMLFGVGLAVMLASHFAIHVGMNIGLLPVTGLPLPFLSYGGSHLLTECVGIGILFGMSRYGRATHRSQMQAEVAGLS